MEEIKIQSGKYMLNSDRLFLRPVDSVDLSSVHEILSFPETNRFNTLGIPKSIDKTALILDKWISSHVKMPSRKFTFAVFDRESARLIGLFALNAGSKKYKNAEIWYKFHVHFWNRGFAIEALNTILEFGFESLKLHRIEAGCAAENLRSIKMLEKAGLLREGCRRKAIPLQSGWADCVEYGITEEDYRAQFIR